MSPDNPGYAELALLTPDQRAELIAILEGAGWGNDDTPKGERLYKAAGRWITMLGGQLQ